MHKKARIFVCGLMVVSFKNLRANGNWTQIARFIYLAYQEQGIITRRKTCDIFIFGRRVVDTFFRLLFSELPTTASQSE